MFILLSGTPPFYHEDNFELFEIIKKGEYDFGAPAWKEVSAEAKDLIKKLLVIDPNNRITAKGIREHAWITGNYTKKNSNLNVLGAMREWNTNRKLLKDL